MPNPNKPEKELNKQIVAAYQNIKDITGLKFDEYDFEEVQKALGQIYINGEDLFISEKFQVITSVVDATVLDISRKLTEIKEGAGFISLMNPNDPYAVPKVLHLENKWDEAGKDYESEFQESHRENIARLDKELEHYKMPESEYLTASNYFAPEQFNRKNGRFRRQSDIWELSGTEQAVQLCNLVLLGRGYTEQELLGNHEEVALAKRNVAAELTEVMYGNGLSITERSRRFKVLVEDSMEGLNRLSFRPVDLGNDKTLENLKYNQWIANMAENLRGVLSGAKQAFRSQWIADTEKELTQICNFTSGVTTLDRMRLKGVNGELRDAESKREPVLAQLFVEKAGISYDSYHKTAFGKAKSDLNLKDELSNTLKDHIHGNKEYEVALERGREAQYENVFKQITERDLDNQRNDTVYKLQQDMDRAGKGATYAWVDTSLYASYKDYGKDLTEIYAGGGGSISQLSRPCTMEALILAYGLWNAEQNHEQLSIKDFYDNAELQKKTGTDAIKFLKMHSMGSTDEEKKECIRAFSNLIAALNRKLADTEIPKYDYLDDRDPKQAEEHRAYLERLKTLMCDSHQLRDVVAEQYLPVFYEAHGGQDAYERAQNQIKLAETMTSILADQISSRDLKNKSLNSLFWEDKAGNACRGLYFLRHGGAEYLGKKISELPEDDSSEKIENTLQGVRAYMEDRFPSKSQYQEGIREYLRSYGENDPEKIEQTISDIQKEIQGKPEEQKEEPLDDSVVAMPDPGDNMEDLLKEQVREKKIRPEIQEIQEIQEELPQIREEETVLKDVYDWSGELSPIQWKERLTRFYKEIDEHDPAWLHSSEEFRDVKHNLKKALDLFESDNFSREAFNSRMEKVFRRAGDYIDKKNTKGVGKHYGKERLTSITELRELLAGRNKNPLDLKGIADIFGQRGIGYAKGEKQIVEDGATCQEKLERGMMRLGIYLASAENDRTEIKKGKLDLVERVIAEHGKNPETRSRLMDEMAQIRLNGNTGALMEQTMEMIIDKMMERNKLDNRMAAWGKILKALESTVENSQEPQIKNAVDVKKIKQHLMLSKFAEKTQEARNKILESEKTESLSKEEAGAIVATATISRFMKCAVENENAWNAFRYFVNGKSEDELTTYFENSKESEGLRKHISNIELKKAVGGVELELLGNAGVKEICKMMIGQQKNKEKQEMKNEMKNEKNNVRAMH